MARPHPHGAAPRGLGAISWRAWRVLNGLCPQDVADELKLQRQPRWVAPLIVVLIVSQVAVAVLLKINAGTPLIPWTAALVGAAAAVWIAGAIALAWPRRIPKSASGRATTSGDVKHDLTSVTIALGLEVLAVILLDSAFDLRVGLAVLAVFLVWIAIWIPRKSRRIDVTTSIDVNRPPHVAFDFVSNPTNEHLYIPEVDVAQPVPVPLEVGSVIHWRRRAVNGPPFEWDERVVDYQPGKSIRTLVLDDLHSIGQVDFIGVDGGTRITFRYRSVTRFQIALLGRLLRRPSRNEMLAAHRTTWNQQLKAVLEAADFRTV